MTGGEVGVSSDTIMARPKAKAVLEAHFTPVSKNQIQLIFTKN